MPGIFEMVKDDLMFLGMDKRLVQEPNGKAIPDHDAWISPLMNVVSRCLLYFRVTAILASVSARQALGLWWRTCHLQRVYPNRMATHGHSRFQISDTRDPRSGLLRYLPPMRVGESRPRHEVPFHSKKAANDPK